MGVGLIVACT